MICHVQDITNKMQQRIAERIFIFNFMQCLIYFRHHNVMHEEQACLYQTHILSSELLIYLFIYLLAHFYQNQRNHLIREKLAESLNF